MVSPAVHSFSNLFIYCAQNILVLSRKRLIFYCFNVKIFLFIYTERAIALLFYGVMKIYYEKDMWHTMVVMKLRLEQYEIMRCRDSCPNNFHEEKYKILQCWKTKNNLGKICWNKFQFSNKNMLSKNTLRQDFLNFYLQPKLINMSDPILMIM